MRSVYLDHAATTPVHPEVLEAMLPYFGPDFGNASSVHGFGRKGRMAIDRAREIIAKAIGAQVNEIYFTSGGTEADNLALTGVAAALSSKGRHIITTAIEHPAILDTCAYLQRTGCRVTYLPVNAQGLLDPEDVRRAIDDDTVLVSIGHANNEVGVVQPMAEIGAIVKEKGVYLHTDAVQSFTVLPIDVNKMQVDLLSLSGHKIYGPKGVGALYVRRGTRLWPLLHGGGQERKLRPGTENVPAIVGLGKATELALAKAATRVERITALRERLIAGLVAMPHVTLNGHPHRRLPGNVNVSVKYVEGESLILALDLKGVAVSSGSACTSGSLEPSHVLMAMGLDHLQAHGSLRLTLGRENTEEDVDYTLEAFRAVVERLRAMSPLYNKLEREE